MIRLRFIAELQNSEHKLKGLENLKLNPDAAIKDILLVIQQREQAVQFVNKQNEPNETVSFVRNGLLRKKTTESRKSSTVVHNKAKECPKCGTRHEQKSCAAFGKMCNNCKKPNHFAKVCRMKKQTNHFVSEEAHIEEISGSTSDYSYYFGHTDYITNGTMEKIEVNGKEIPMMKDTGASLTLISKQLWKQIGQPELKEKNTGIETNDKHKKKYLGAFFSTVLFNNKVLKVNIAVVDADRNFGIMGRDIIDHSQESIDRCFKAEVSEKLPTGKGALASIKMKPYAKPMFCADGRYRCHLNERVKKQFMNYFSWESLKRWKPVVFIIVFRLCG